MCERIFWCDELSLCKYTTVGLLFPSILISVRCYQRKKHLKLSRNGNRFLALFLSTISFYLPAFPLRIPSDRAKNSSLRLLSLSVKSPATPADPNLPYLCPRHYWIKSRESGTQFRSRRNDNMYVITQSMERHRLMHILQTILSALQWIIGLSQDLGSLLKLRPRK